MENPQKHLSANLKGYSTCLWVSRYFDSGNCNMYCISNYCDISHFSSIYVLFLIAGMSSLFSTLTFSALRLMIIKRENNVWFQSCKFTCKETRALQIIWLLSISFALPPFFGFGKYGKDFIGVRYKRVYV